MSRVGWFDRFLSWIGFEIEEGPEAAAAAEPAPPRSRDRWGRRPAPSSRAERAERTETPPARGQLVSLPGGTAQRVVIAVPRTFDDVQAIADHLRNRRPVIVNLEGADRELAQRVVHFLSGTVYALSGETHRVSSGTLFFAPGGVEVLFEGSRPPELQGG